MCAAIQTYGLTKRYGETLALDSLDLTVREGEVYGYLGPNGAGKTTTIRLLLGLHRASEGRAELFGIDAWKDPVTAQRRVAYVAGKPALWPQMTAAETFEFLTRLHGGVDVAYRDELVERFKLDADKKVSALSKANRQKVQLVAALATRADLLLLDEPTSGLDPLMEVAFRETGSRGEGARPDDLPLLPHPQRGRGALPDPGGILRNARLVDEGTLDKLYRHLSAQTVEVTFARQPPSDVLTRVSIEGKGEALGWGAENRLRADRRRPRPARQAPPSTQLTPCMRRARTSRSFGRCSGWSVRPSGDRFIGARTLGFAT